MIGFEEVKFCGECGIILHVDYQAEEGCGNCNSTAPPVCGLFPKSLCNTLQWLIEYGYADSYPEPVPDIPVDDLSSST